MTKHIWLSLALENSSSLYLISLLRAIQANDDKPSENPSQQYLTNVIQLAKFFRVIALRILKKLRKWYSTNFSRDACQAAVLTALSKVHKVKVAIQHKRLLFSYFWYTIVAEMRRIYNISSDRAFPASGWDFKDILK